MSDPRRLREETGSELERALLNAGVSYRASAETRAKALAVLGLAGTTAVLAGNASAATLASVAKISFAKVVAVVSLAGAVAVVPVGYYISHRQDAAAAAQSERSARASVAVTAPAEPVEPAAAPIEVAAPIAPVASRGAATVARTAKAESRSSGANASLTRELAALDAARTTLAGGQAAAALALLDTYSRDFPHGRLEIEAEVLRIDALARAGRGGAAKKRAAAFVHRYPDSVFAERVRGFLEN